MGPQRNKYQLLKRHISPTEVSSRIACRKALYIILRHPAVMTPGDPCGNRTRVTGVRGRCLDRLTNGPGTAFSGFARRGFADGRSKGCRPLDPAWYRLRRFWILKRYAFGMKTAFSGFARSGFADGRSWGLPAPCAPTGAASRPSLRLDSCKVCLRHISLNGLPRSCLAAGLVRHQGLEPGTR